MSITAASSQSQIWNSATTALSQTPSVASAPSQHGNQADNPRAAKAQSTGSIASGGANLLDTLSQTSQAALLQMQAQMSQRTG